MRNEEEKNRYAFLRAEAALVRSLKAETLEQRQRATQWWIAWTRFENTLQVKQLRTLLGNYRDQP